MKERRGLKILIIGYHRSGKSTSVVSTVLASELNKIEMGATLSWINAGSDVQKQRYLQNFNRLMKNDVVAKTELTDWIKLGLRMSLAKRDYEIELVDYPGDILIDPKQFEDSSDLVKFLLESDALYLFFDATLCEGAKSSSIKYELLRGQVNAINQAQFVYYDKRPGRPVVFVVTKSDRLFEGFDPVEIEQEIESLNRNPFKAKAKFKELFGKQARLLLKRKGGRKPYRIVYVAALGAAPKAFENPNLLDPMYSIESIETWEPIGLEKMWMAGTYRASDVVEEKTARQRWKKHKLKFLAVAQLLVLLFLWFVWDANTAEDVGTLAAKYDAGIVQNPNYVLEDAEKALRFYHPYIWLPGAKTIFGPIPHWEGSETVVDVHRRFRFIAMKERLGGLEQRNDLVREGEIEVASFQGAVDRLERLQNDWKDMLADARDLIEEEGDPEEKTRIENEVLAPSREGLASLLVDAVGLVWEAAANFGMSEGTAKPTALIYLTALEQMDFPEARGRVADATAAFRSGKCQVLVNEYKKMDPNDASHFDVFIGTLAKICLDCEASMPEGDCKRLLSAYVDEWDRNDAENLLESFPGEQGASALTGDHLQMFKTYLGNCEKRREFIGRSGVYENEANLFVQWTERLDGVHNLGSLAVIVDRDGPFPDVEYHTEERCPGLWEPCYDVQVKDVIPPDGELEMFIDGKKVAEGGFSGFHGNVPVQTGVRWSPGQAVEIRVGNRHNDAQVVKEFKGEYSLVRFAEQGMKTNALEVTPIGFDLPPMEPASLSPLPESGSE